MKNRNTHIWIAMGAIALLTACGAQMAGKQDTQSSQTNSQGTENSSGSSATSTGTGTGTGTGNGNGGAACGSPNSVSGNGNTTSLNPNNLDPNAFKYGYDTGYRLPPNSGPNGGLVIILTTDPNACDTGSLVLKAGQPTVTYVGSIYHAGLVSTNAAMSTTAPVSSGECRLLGGDPNNQAQLSSSIAHGFGGPTEGFYTYSLSFGDKQSTLFADPNIGTTNFRTIPCKFAVNADPNATAVDPNVLVPCTP